MNLDSCAAICLHLHLMVVARHLSVMEDSHSQLCTKTDSGWSGRQLTSLFAAHNALSASRRIEVTSGPHKRRPSLCWRGNQAKGPIRVYQMKRYNFDHQDKKAADKTLPNLLSGRNHCAYGASVSISLLMMLYETPVDVLL